MTDPGWWVHSVREVRTGRAGDSLGERGVLTMSCWSLGSISLKAGLPRAGEGPRTWWEGMLQNRVWLLSWQKQSQVRPKPRPAP